MFNTYARLLIAMATDYLMGKLNDKTFVKNLELFVENIKKEKANVRI